MTDATRFNGVSVTGVVGKFSASDVALADAAGWSRMVIAINTLASRAR